MRVLFIAYDYYQYARAIHKEFELLGVESDFHSIQPETLYLKCARRAWKAAYRSGLDSYHEALILSKPAGYYDKVIFLQVHQMSHENMRRLKERQHKAEFVLYNWDAVRTHDYRPYISYFNRVLTFDSADARALGVEYLPLFCIRDFQQLEERSTGPLSVYFIGSIVNPRRYEAVKAFAAYCADNGIRFDHYLCTTVHGYTQVLKSGFVPRHMVFRSIPPTQFITMMEQASAVFDFANHAQAGFTMRTMENLCAGKRIITNNAGVKESEFYSPDQFLIFQDLDFSGVREFLLKPRQEDRTDWSKYHVQAFARQLAGVTE